jgi:Flp pilus assembly pilin Flp
MKTMVAKTTKHRSRRFRRFIRANEAVSALEYAVLVGVVVVGIGAALGTFTDQIKNGLSKAGNSIAGISGIN